MPVQNHFGHNLTPKVIRNVWRGKGYKYNTLLASSKAILEEEITTHSNYNTIPIMSKWNANSSSKLDTKKIPCPLSSKPKISIQCFELESKKQQFDHCSLILTPDMYKTSVCLALDSDTKRTKTKNGKRTSHFFQQQTNHHPIPKMDYNFETTSTITTNENKKKFKPSMQGSDIIINVGSSPWRWVLNSRRWDGVKRLLSNLSISLRV